MANLVKELREASGEELANKIIILLDLGHSVDDAIQTAIKR